MRAFLLAAVATVGLVGCVGGIDTTTGDPNGSGSNGSGSNGSGSNGSGSNTGSGSGSAADTARIAFNTDVYTTISNKCGGCHKMGATASVQAPGFINPTTPATDDHAAYNTVTTTPQAVGDFSTNANILQLPLSGHQGTSYTATEKAAVTNWLNLEVAWRSSGPTGSQPLDLIAQWSGCMTQTDFDAASNNTGMAQAWANQVNTNEGVCKQCHVNGTSNMIATPQNTYMFQLMSTDRNYLMTFFTIDTTAVPNKVMVNQTPFMIAASGLTASGQHPRGWNATQNNGMTALQDFYTKTMAHLTASPSTCGKPTLLN
jgi:hypothetical protein